MASRPVAWVAASTLVVIVLAGCLGTGSESGIDDDPFEPIADAVPAFELTDAMNFTEHVVEPAVHFGHGLYEPTIDVSDSGVIYISSHTTGVDTTGAPAFFSDDDGETWQQLPFAGPAQLPPPAHGGTPPPSDEIFIVAGDDGQAWGVDITLATFPINGWCGDGAEHCYHNPNGYDEVAGRRATADFVSGQDGSCSVTNVNDRPWAAYENGTLLLVNNPADGTVQVGSMQVPPPTYVSLGNPVTGPQWNMCASSASGGIPGVPDIRPDGFFAVPHDRGDQLVVVTGNADDVMDVEETTVFDNTNVDVSAIGEYGQVVFDDRETMFVAAMNNSADQAGPGAGGIHVALSTGDATDFTERTFRFDRPVSSIFIDANDHGPGAVINWGLVDEEGGPTDWYLGHLRMDEDGQPVIREASLAVEDGPPASRHIQGAAAGPDGRAYMVMSEVSGNDDVAMAMSAGTTPLSVVVQQDGPRLPIAVSATAAS